MARLTDNFFLDPLLGQPLLRAKREDSHDNLFAPVPIAPSELDVSPFGFDHRTVLGEVERSLVPLTLKLKGRPAYSTPNAPALRPA